MVIPRKIEMKLVKSKSARQVTFSKRRNGVFKKANELSILCGALIGMIVFSPGGKPYAFGHPNIEDVINKFVHQDPGHVVNESSKGDDGEDTEDLSKELETIMDQIQVEKDKGVKLDNALNKHKLKKGILNMDGLGVEELVKLKANYKQVIDELNMFIEKLEAASSLLFFAEKAGCED